MAIPVSPTVGRFVHYALTAADVLHIGAQRVARGLTGNNPREGQVCPALVVRTFDGPAVNLQVFLDGSDTLWIPSAMPDEGGMGTPVAPGRWIWPPRV